MTAMTPERLAEIRERADLAAWGAAVDGRPTPDDVALLAHADHLTAENARLREGIVHARWSAEVNESNDTRTLHALLDDLADLLNPPTEGETGHE